MEQYLEKPWHLTLYIKLTTSWNFFNRKNVFLTSKLRCLFCNALIQPHFDYVCSPWYPKLIKKLKHRIQTTQNKCVRFFLLLDKLKHIFHEAFKCLNWLPVNYRFKKCVNSIVFMYFIEQFPNCKNEVFDIATESNFQLRCSFQKLKYLFRKTNNDKYDCFILVPPFGTKTLTQSNIIFKNISKRNLKILIIILN